MCPFMTLNRVTPAWPLDGIMKKHAKTKKVGVGWALGAGCWVLNGCERARRREILPPTQPTHAAAAAAATTTTTTTTNRAASSGCTCSSSS